VVFPNFMRPFRGCGTRFDCRIAHVTPSIEGVLWFIQ